MNSPGAESAPAFKVTKETLIKTPIGLLCLAFSFAIGATAVAVNLSRDVADLRRDMAEVQRVNFAQDKRFEFIETAQAEIPLLKNDLRRLEHTRAP